ncbi:mechanosensitive ion channel family protein [Cesiribacter sp. SM1]|uniref:mechanosensitive ion channel family protein n=1 Tax=Cesiribacter sp. SM1 TaxID=2861196 RepID=UPI001CD33F8A|nr:mechanosensitive ion channel family protein [Cesiribacter sp. SM1]
MLLLMPSTQAQAQLLPNATSEESQEQPAPEWPEDSLGRRTPRGTVYGFINAVAKRNYSRASRYLHLDPGLQNSQEGARVAQVLQRLLDRRGDIMPYAWISNDTTGRVDDNLPPGIDRVGTVTVDGETITLLVEETRGPDGGPIWLFASETVDRIAAITETDNLLLVDRFLPSFLKERLWGGVPIGHWLVMVVLLVAAYLLAWGITSLFLYLIRLLWRRAATEPTAGIIKAFAVPIRIYLTVWLFVFSSQEVGISIIVRQRFSEITIIIGLLALLLLLWRLTEFISGFTERRLTLRNHISGVSAVLFLRRVAKIAIVFFGIIAILGTFGVDVTAGLAALGIGGIALALGAQKTVENFVGSVTLIADQPIRVGDFCKIGDTVGTVEQIGMRSTRIRTLDRTIVTIPNGELSSTKIENYAHRDRFRFFTVFGLRYETTPDQMRYLLVEMRAILYAHPKVDPDPARIRFIELGSASLNLEVFAYIHAKDFNQFMEIREDLLLRMMDVVEASGTGFAFPSQTLYLARDKGLSKEKTNHAEETVRKWREEGEMQIPNFDASRINELKGSIPYPPQGSAQQDNTK